MLKKIFKVLSDKRFLIGGSSFIVGLGLLSFFKKKKAAVGGATMYQYPLPPWASEFPSEWVNIAFWKNLGATPAKILTAQVAKKIQNTPLHPKPSFAELEEAYKQISALFDVPYQIVRGHHRYETYKQVAPLTVNDHSTAAGLGQFLKGTSEDIGVPYAYQIYWKTAIWSTAKYLKQRGWNRGNWLPSVSELNTAAANAGTPAEPSWFKTNRAYYSLSPEKLAKSTKYAKERIMAGVNGFAWATDPNLSYWNKIPHEDRLVKFFNGTAKSIDWKKA